MSIKHLFIIGNGFDRAHNLPTAYSNFRSYLIDTFPEAEEYDGAVPEIINNDYGYNHNDVAGYIISVIDSCEDEGWGSLEECLGDRVFDCFSYDFDETNLDDSEKEFRHAFYNNEDISRSICDSFQHIKEFFGDWIKEYYSKFNYGHIPPLSGKPSILRQDSIDSVLREGDGFINFNYTMTLERVYDITNEKICHIHGKVGESQEDIYFGHGDEDSISESSYQAGSESNLDELKTVLRKDTNGAYTKHKDFFDRIDNELVDIHTYGFSFSDVDMYYVKKIAESVDPTCITWYINKYDADKRTEDSPQGRKLDAQIKKVEAMGFKIVVDDRW